MKSDGSGRVKELEGREVLVEQHKHAKESTVDAVKREGEVLFKKYSPSLPHDVSCVIYMGGEPPESVSLSMDVVTKNQFNFLIHSWRCRFRRIIISCADYYGVTRRTPPFHSQRFHHKRRACK